MAKVPATQAAKAQDEPALGALATMGELYQATKHQGYAIPPLLPAPGVVMFSGPRSSLKTYILTSLSLMMVYGQTWPVGRKRIAAGLVFYVAGENADELPIRHRAWLRANGIAETENIEDGFISVQPDKVDYAVNLASGKTQQHSGLDILDEASVRRLIEICKGMCDEAKKPARALVFDTLTSLVGRQLRDEVCKALIRNSHMIARELNCCVIFVNHTHRNDPTKSQGSFVLANSIDCDYLIQRDVSYRTEGVQTGLRAVVSVQRMKRSRDLGVAFEFIGQPVTLGENSAGDPIETLAMRCVGLVNPDIDHSAVRRAEIARALLRRATEARQHISIAQAVAEVGWGKGGVQYDWVRAAIPESEVMVNLGKSDSGRFAALMMQRVKKGIAEQIHFQAIYSDEPADQAKTEPAHEPEVEAAKKASAKKADATAPHKRKAIIGRGMMTQADYEHALERSLAGDDRKAMFFDVIEAMRAAGATIDERAGKVLTFLRGLGTDVASMEPAAKLFSASTVAEVLRRGAMMHVASLRKPREPAKSSKNDDKPSDTKEGNG